MFIKNKSHNYIYWTNCSIYNFYVPDEPVCIAGPIYLYEVLTRCISLKSFWLVIVHSCVSAVYHREFGWYIGKVQMYILLTCIYVI
jgi:hypothetical protein